MTKPTNLAAWGATATKVEPSSGVKSAGWAPDQRPPAQWLNWWMNAVALWMVWLNEFESTVHTWTAGQTFGDFAQFNNSVNFNDQTSVNAADFNLFGAGNTFTCEQIANFSGTASFTGALSVVNLTLTGLLTAHSIAAVNITSNATSGYGLEGISDDLAGVHGVGNNTAVPGGLFQGGASGYGLQSTGGAGAAGAHLVPGTGSLNALKADGFIDLSSGTNPAYNSAWKDVVTRMNTVKGWCVLTLHGAAAPGGAAGAVDAGFNMPTVTRSGNIFLVEFGGGTGMAAAPYAVHIQLDFGAGGVFLHPHWDSTGNGSPTTQVSFGIRDASGNLVTGTDAVLAGLVVAIQVVGAQ